MANLPTREEIFTRALGQLDIAYRALGDAGDELRSDWRPAGSSLTTAQAKARDTIGTAIAEAKKAINTAKGAAYDAID